MCVRENDLIYWALGLSLFATAVSLAALVAGMIVNPSSADSNHNLPLETRGGLCFRYHQLLQNAAPGQLLCWMSAQRVLPIMPVLDDHVATPRTLSAVSAIPESGMSALAGTRPRP